MLPKLIFSSFIIASLLCAQLSACNDKDELKPQPVQSAKALEITHENKTSAIDKEKINTILGFHNRAVEELQSGYYSLPKKISRNSQYYLTHWKLPAKLKIPAKNKRIFRIPENIFSDSEAAALTSSYETMDKALSEMISDYHKLEAYIADDSIQDDGDQGRRLTERLAAENTKFMAARKSWLNIVEEAAARAEDSLLADEPLARQVIAARNILQIINEISELVMAGELQRQNLGMTIQSLETNIQTGQRPPFPAAPNLERLYKNFITFTKIYAGILKKIELDGLFSAQINELTQAAGKCQNAYNTFAQAINSRSK